MINSGTNNYAGYLGAIGDIMTAESEGSQDELNAQLQIRKGLKNARQIRKEGAKSVAKMRTAVAKSGFQTTGSVLDAIIDRAGDVEEDAQNIIIQSKINADAYNDRARNAKYQQFMKMGSSFFMGAYGG
jgi:hypothetical protein